MIAMLEQMLKSNGEVSDYKINIHEIKSYELFFVKEKLETVRTTKTCDTSVTVYCAHDEFLGDAEFLVYPSTTEEQLAARIGESVAKAKLICNKPYSLPSCDAAEYEVGSNFAEFAPKDLAAKVAELVFASNKMENGSLNSVEVFINRHTETVLNSRGIRKTQVRYDAMVEAIPTYNGSEDSVELYEQYNFNSLDEQALCKEIAEKMLAVKARYEAKKPAQEISSKVILNKLELAELFRSIAGNLSYSAVYAHSTKFHKGDRIQTDPQGDRIQITMRGEVTGNIKSAKFDDDGCALRDVCIVKNGEAAAYYGDNRFGQYLNEQPTGKLRCLCVDAGSTEKTEFTKDPYLEVVSMSGLQVDFFGDYVGGEVRLAYYHDGEKVTPVTGISISGSVTEALNQIQLSNSLGTEGGYTGPEKAILHGMKIY